MLLVFSSVSHSAAKVTDSTSHSRIIHQFEASGRITIEANSQFTSVFDGSGTPEDPYYLEGVNITDTVTAIQISSTTAPFVFRDCLFTSNYITISLHDVHNGTFENCRFIGLNDGIWSVNSSNIVISDSEIIGYDTGIRFDQSEDISIESNELHHNHVAIELPSANRTNVESNTIYGNRDRGIVVGLDSHNCTVIENSIGWNGGVVETDPIRNAIDSGNGTEWSSNRWSDYNGTGDYIIAGSANSNDTLPRTLVDNDDPVLPEIDDLIYVLGESNNSLKWTPTDAFPLRYVIYRNSLPAGSSDWYGQPIEINVDGLDFGAYNFTIVVRDAEGNEAISMAYVHVTMDMFGGQGTVIILGGSLLSVLVVLITILAVKTRN